MCSDERGHCISRPAHAPGEPRGRGGESHAEQRKRLLTLPHPCDESLRRDARVCLGAQLILPAPRLSLSAQVVTLLDDVLIPYAMRIGLVGFRSALIRVDALHVSRHWRSPALVRILARLAVNQSCPPPACLQVLSSELLELRRQLFERFSRLGVTASTSATDGVAVQGLSHGVSLRAALAMAEILEPTRPNPELQRDRVKAAFLQTLSLGAVGGVGSPNSRRAASGSATSAATSEGLAQHASGSLRVLDEPLFWEMMVRMAMISLEPDWQSAEATWWPLSESSEPQREPRGAELPFSLAEVTPAQLKRLRAALQAMEGAVTAEVEGDLLRVSATKRLQAFARGQQAINVAHALAEATGRPLRYLDERRSKAAKRRSKAGARARSERVHLPLHPSGQPSQTAVGGVEGGAGSAEPPLTARRGGRGRY